MFATSLALIGQEFQGKDRATAFGVWGATVGGAVAIGPLVGGVITEHLGWEWIFFVNVPIGIAAIVADRAQDRQRRRQGRRSRIDLPGLVTFSLALFLLIFGLIRGNPEGWGSPLIVACCSAPRSSARGLRRDRARSDHPMLDLQPVPQARLQRRLARSPSALSAGMFAMFLYLTIYIQGVLGYSPLEAGLRFLPLTVLSFFVAPIAGALSHRIPIRVLLGVGLALVGVGLLLMHGVERRLGLDDAARRLPRRRRRDRHHQPGDRPGGDRRRPGREAGMGSGINTTFRQVGIATGVAGARRDLPVAGRLEARRAAAAARRAGSAKWSPRAARSAAAAVVPPGSTAEVVHASTVAFVSGFNEIILIAAIISFVGAALGFVLVRSQRLRPADGGRARRRRDRREPVPRLSAWARIRRAAARQGACCASCGSRTCC